MIVCQCNVISERDIEEAVLELLADDAWRLIVPTQVYQLLNKRGRCCGCFPNTMDVIVRTVEAYHGRKETPVGDVMPLMTMLRARQREQKEACKRSHKSDAGAAKHAG